MRPLTLEATDSRYVPTNDRYVPTQVQPDDAQPAARTEKATVAEAPAPPAASSQPTAPPAAPPDALPAAAPAPRVQPVSGPPVAPVTSASGQRVEGDDRAAESEGDERESWIVPPEAPGRVLSGQLGGDDNGTGADAPEPTNAPTEAERYVPPVTQGAAPQQPGGMEEHAEAVDPRIGEETGAAQPPARPQPQGEYARHEEVGSPDAPRADEEEPAEGLIGA